MEYGKNFTEMMKEFSMLDEVEGILLAGSRATHYNDKDSDYDVCIYLNKEISLEIRKQITDKYCSYMELNNTFWETEDDGMLRDDKIAIELIYRDYRLLDTMLERTLVRCEADIGYSTCFWANLLHSIILFDKTGKLHNLKEKYRIDYPKELKQNIINKNYSLLKLKMPAYYYQIEKALKRGDMVSVNHRVAALFASYFDILFAVNEMPHPGEKRMLKILQEDDKKIPMDMSENVANILKFAASHDDSLLLEIDKLVINISSLLKKEGVWEDWMDDQM
ncbi:DUF4037 domain-containing protein [Anaeromicropila herbilytica]|uniref:Nucleotidyltransferase n=1 Tax=Anaeromicropila herbilytica TaxID=2785025 RepID=A0A7R7ENE0_9FIRM|nr:DUF4037 domain-containing protein [Anaeromicropila herbilytica]BCN31786.1 nucleotidyltransferase [Anaeromicropila herbilytica]